MVIKFEYVSLDRAIGEEPGFTKRAMRRRVYRDYRKGYVTRINRNFYEDLKITTTRDVLIPSNELKCIQRKLNVFLGQFEVSPIAHAYVPGRGIVTNASQHLNANSILHVDLSDFFRSITYEMVRDCFRNLLSAFSYLEIEAITKLCCYRGFLPQGAPSSPTVANLVFVPIDQKLDEMARSFGSVVSRYSDDIGFSTTAPMISSELAQLSYDGAAPRVSLGAPLRSLMRNHGFEINRRKLRLQSRPDILMVNGLIVTDRLRVSPQYRKNIRAILHYWQCHGLSAAANRHNPYATPAEFVGSLRGYIDYVGQVEGRNSQLVRGFLNSFVELRSRDGA